MSIVSCISYWTVSTYLWLKYFIWFCKRYNLGEITDNNEKNTSISPTFATLQQHNIHTAAGNSVFNIYVSCFLFLQLILFLICLDIAEYALCGYNTDLRRFYQIN